MAQLRRNRWGGAGRRSPAPYVVSQSQHDRRFSRKGDEWKSTRSGSAAPRNPGVCVEVANRGKPSSIRHALAHLFPPGRICVSLSHRSNPNTYTSEGAGGSSANEEAWEQTLQEI